MYKVDHVIPGKTRRNGHRYQYFYQGRYRKSGPLFVPAGQERRGKLTNVTKSNTLIHTLAYWDRVIAEVAESYPEVEYQKMYVDAASAKLRFTSGIL